jgi:hypothetical protein
LDDCALEESDVEIYDSIFEILGNSYSFYLEIIQIKGALPLFEVSFELNSLNIFYLISVFIAMFCCF